MITIFYKLIRNMYLKLPKNTSLKDLYLEDDQTIWFLIWILKKAMSCDRYVSEMILETPFQIIKNIDEYEYQRQYIRKNGQKHGLGRGWFEIGQLLYETHWKNGKPHGLTREWHRNGQLEYEANWENGQRHGRERAWYQNGELRYEHHWKNGKVVSSKKN